MDILYSNILPLALPDGQTAVSDALIDEIQNADRLELAVGYVSKASLEELDRLVEKNNIKYISLVIGMYYIEGMPEGTYHTAVAINEKWMAAGIGEIRMVKAFKYHGKLYAFLKEGTVRSAVLGSANLGVLKLDANNRRQYEVSARTTEANSCNAILTLIRQLQEPRCSANLADITDMPLIRETNVSLTGVDTVEQITKAEVIVVTEIEINT